MLFWGTEWLDSDICLTLATFLTLVICTVMYFDGDKFNMKNPSTL